MSRLMGVYILEYKWEMAYTALERECNSTVQYSLNGDFDEQVKCKTYKSVFAMEAMIRIDI